MLAFSLFFKIKLCIFYVHDMMTSYTYDNKMIIALELVNMPSTHVCDENTSVSIFRVFNTVLLAIVIMLYIRCL